MNAASLQQEFRLTRSLFPNRAPLGKKIFQLFYRSENELTRETVGTGIGLALVHQLVAAMHGTLDVVNRDPGAEFEVAFPAVPPDDAG